MMSIHLRPNYSSGDENTHINLCYRSCRILTVTLYVKLYGKTVLIPINCGHVCIRQLRGKTRWKHTVIIVTDAGVAWHLDVTRRVPVQRAFERDEIPYP